MTSRIFEFVEAGNIKFKTSERESMYQHLRENDETGLFTNLGDIFYTAFSIGYHFDDKKELKKGAINHVNLVSIPQEIRELMVILVLKRNPKITNPKELWKDVELYAEYGINVLFNSWKEKRRLDIDDILGKKSK